MKALYIVHPTFWIKTTFKFFKPFISSKFWQKLTYVNEINEIYRFISRDSITLPQFVFELKTNENIHYVQFLIKFFKKVIKQLKKLMQFLEFLWKKFLQDLIMPILLIFQLLFTNVSNT